MDEVSLGCEILFVVVFSPSSVLCTCTKMYYIKSNYNILSLSYYITRNNCMIYICVTTVYIIQGAYCLPTAYACVSEECILYIYTTLWKLYYSMVVCICILYYTYVYIIIILCTCCGCPPGDNTSRQLESSTYGKQKLFLFEIIVLKYILGQKNSMNDECII